MPHLRHWHIKQKWSTYKPTYQNPRQDYELKSPFDMSCWVAPRAHDKVSSYVGRWSDTAQSLWWVTVIVVNLNETVNVDSRQSRAQQKIINGPTNEYEYGGQNKMVRFVKWSVISIVVRGNIILFNNCCSFCLWIILREIFIYKFKILFLRFLRKNHSINIIAHIEFVNL